MPRLCKVFSNVFPTPEISFKSSGLRVGFFIPKAGNFLFTVRFLAAALRLTGLRGAGAGLTFLASLSIRSSSLIRASRDLIVF